MQNKILRTLIFVPVPAGILAGFLYFNNEVQSCKKALCNLPVQKIENLSRIAQNSPDPVRQGEAAIAVTRELQMVSESADALASAAYAIKKEFPNAVSSNQAKKAISEAEIQEQIRFIVSEATELLKQNKTIGVETIATAFLVSLLACLGCFILQSIVFSFIKYPNCLGIQEEKS